MEEDKRINIDTEDLKNQTKDTVKQVKDTIKDVDFKNDAKEATGFVKGMVDNAYDTVGKVASGEENVLKKSIVIMIVFIAASLIKELLFLFKYGSLANLGGNLMDIIQSVANPIFYVLVPAVLVFVMNKANKKTLPTVLTTIITAAIPAAIAEVVGLVNSLIPALSIVISPINTALYSVSAILTYLGMKDLFAEEDHNKFLKTFAIIEVLTAFVLYLLSSAGIY